MTDTSSRWDDLAPRILTATALAAIGLAAIWLGGMWFTLLVAVSAGVMIWELARMLDPVRAEAPLILGLLAGVALIGGEFLGARATLVVLAALAALGMIWLRHQRLLFMGYGTMVLTGCYAIVALRAFGPVWVFWLVLLVIACDTAGYFVGRKLGGPKFWPRVSPKKTWSGTVAGWVGAAAIGAVFMPITGAGPSLIIASALVALAGQLGDIAESAVNRRQGIKDASAILPGHGGVLDRFDALIAAALAVILLYFSFGWPAMVVP